MLPNLLTNPKQGPYLPTRGSAGITSTTKGRLIMGMQVTVCQVCPTFSPQRATAVTVGWLVDSTFKIHSA